MELVDEYNNAAVRLFDLFHEGLQSFLEFPTKPGSRYHRPQVEGDNTTSLKEVGHVSLDDPLGQPFHDGRFSHPGLADEDGVVLCASTEDLNHPLDLLITPNDGIELVLCGQGRQVLAVLLQRAEVGFRRGAGDPAAVPDLLDGGLDGIPGDSRAAQDLGSRGIALPRDGQEKVLRAHIFVVQATGLLLGPIDDPFESGGNVNLPHGLIVQVGHPPPRHASQVLLHLLTHGLQGGP